MELMCLSADACHFPDFYSKNILSGAIFSEIHWDTSCAIWNWLCFERKKAELPAGKIRLTFFIKLLNYVHRLCSQSVSGIRSLDFFMMMRNLS